MAAHFVWWQLPLYLRPSSEEAVGRQRSEQSMGDSALEGHHWEQGWQARPPLLLLVASCLSPVLGPSARMC